MLLLDIGQDLLRLRRELETGRTEKVYQRLEDMIELIESDIGQPLALPDYETGR